MEKQDGFEKIDLCSCNVIHNDIVKKVKESLPTEETIFDLSEFFKVFSDSTRIKILSSLLVSEMCVCDLAAVLGTSQSAISHQLRLLKVFRLVKSRKAGKVVYYSLSDDHVKSIIELGLAHLSENQ
ncbi:transcriptional regulator, ArsR family [Caldicellulosiruptor owensensis OL]|uniref:Transcriptional regulator, ArsR family n=1 Tax=Caldicellulosiruptor owensensis (strain ATCC 700167 / DSM 13100 / OL) TaxID=632518 RepID=E4Q2Q9_CALOW|nr:metalloregulator ArsR/SmtB family transcription factor [Caldicellulosiruptor owensensis]ADQ03813.1 transcriptional regulator, ArsR family [Caldicellulosiruptor owensensis OL]